MIFDQTVSRIALAGSLLFCAVPAMAQEIAADPAQAKVEADATTALAAPDRAPAPASDDTVVVTGSRIQRPNMTSAAPITSVTAQDIRAQAPTNIEDVLNRLPQIAPDAQQNYQDSDGRQRIKLRSLGFERTLTLIDGKRIGTQNGADVGIIPPSLLERVDVLTGGASSVYGSDAVAGVVNFILKKDFEGLQIDGNYNFYNHDNKDTIVSSLARANSFGSPRGFSNDGGRADITVTAGKKLFDGKLRLSGFVNYRHTDAVDYDARSTSACQADPDWQGRPALLLALDLFAQRLRLAALGREQRCRLRQRSERYAHLRALRRGAGNAANPYDGYSYQRGSERWNAGGFVSADLTSDIEVYGSGIWFRDKSENVYPARIYSYTVYGDQPYRVNCNNPYLSGSQATAICGGAAGTNTKAPIELRYRFNDLADIPDTYINSGVRATGGFRGKVDDIWTWDVGGVYARNQQVVNYGNLPDYNRVNQSLDVVNVNGVATCASGVAGCVPFNAFTANTPGQPLASWLFTAPGGTTKGVGTLWDGLISVTGDLGKYGVTSPLATQGVAIALGAEYRHDNYTSTADTFYRDLNGGNDLDISQSVWESNIEVQAPLIEDRPFAHLLQANGGYRVSKYSSNPKTFNTWKIEGIYAPVSDLTFRGSYNKAQRAPTVIEIGQARNISYGLQGGSQNDFCAPTVTTNPTTGAISYGTPVASRDVCRATGLSDALYGSPTLLCNQGDGNQCTVQSGDTPRIRRPPTP
ncbi:TonB-dependent receptor plug domain-containing protein [Sphingomonas aurantiaca]|uniref:TonB-dependent receptor plug domain-containing protein n=1 Tax=Sphingomonas aurantiaca TaxID=185949 RepID=UPI002FDF4880